MRYKEVVKQFEDVKGIYKELGIEIKKLEKMVSELEDHSESIKKGLRKAKGRGMKLGAKPEFQMYTSHVRRLRDKGYTWKKIYEELGIDYRTAKKAYHGHS